MRSPHRPPSERRVRSAVSGAGPVRRPFGAAWHRPNRHRGAGWGGPRAARGSPTLTADGSNPWGRRGRDTRTSSSSTPCLGRLWGDGAVGVQLAIHGCTGQYSRYCVCLTHGTEETGMILQRGDRARERAALRHGRHERGAAEVNGDHDPAPVSPRLATSSRHRGLRGLRVRGLRPVRCHALRGYSRGRRPQPRPGRLPLPVGWRGWPGDAGASMVCRRSSIPCGLARG